MSAARKRHKEDVPISDTEIQLQAILNAAVDGIIGITPDGRVKTFNPAAERLFGYKASEVLGKSVNLLMPEPHSRRHTQYIDTYLKTGKAKVIGVGRELVGRHANGALIPLELAVSEVKTEGHHSFVGIVRDITYRKRLEQAIVDASEMERKQIGQDLHDTVSQHLAGLTMITRVLQQKISQISDDRVWDLASEAQRIADLADTALKQVKDISHGLYPVELERNGLGTALQHLAQRQEELFGIPCVYHGSTRLPQPEDAVAVHLYRIAQEAISNAIKHAEAKQIDVHWGRVSDGLQLMVQDDGKGVPRRPKPGTGLGLAIMHYRAKMIGTDLELISSRGKGTCIRCTVRLKD